MRFQNALLEIVCLTGLVVGVGVGMPAPACAQGGVPAKAAAAGLQHEHPDHGPHGGALLECFAQDSRGATGWNHLDFVRAIRS